jgi:hypothetical protein
MACLLLIGICNGGPMRPAETEDFHFVAHMLRWLEEVEAQGKAKERIRVS